MSDSSSTTTSCACAPRGSVRACTRWPRILLLYRRRSSSASPDRCRRGCSVAPFRGQSLPAAARRRCASGRTLRAGHGSPRRSRRAAHRSRHAGRSVCRAGLRDRAGPAVADGRFPPQRQWRIWRRFWVRRWSSTTRRSASFQIRHTAQRVYANCRLPTAPASTTTPAA